MFRFNLKLFNNFRRFGTVNLDLNEIQPCPQYMELSPNIPENSELGQNIIKSMLVYNDFITKDEEISILNEIEPYMKRLKYEFDHWDDAIHGYRETERYQWNDMNTKILNRVRKLAFPEHVSPLKHVHILDLDEKGYIKPHIDAVRFCGDTIAGLSLLSDSVMRLINENDKSLFFNVYLKQRSLYIMKGVVRYHYTHEILSNENSRFKDEIIKKKRRISVICRNEPNPNQKT